MSILTEISQNLQQGRAKAVKEFVEKAVAEGIDAKAILEQGLLEGMSIIGENSRTTRFTCRRS